MWRCWSSIWERITVLFSHPDLAMRLAATGPLCDAQHDFSLCWQRCQRHEPWSWGPVFEGAQHQHRQSGATPRLLHVQAMQKVIMLSEIASCTCWPCCACTMYKYILKALWKQHKNTQGNGLRVELIHPSVREGKQKFLRTEITNFVGIIYSFIKRRFLWRHFKTNLFSTSEGAEGKKKKKVGEQGEGSQFRSHCCHLPFHFGTKLP